jgi:ribosomal protein S1
VTSKISSKEPATMEALLASYQGSIHGFSKGQRLTGKVLSKTPKALVLDIGGKSEGNREGFYRSQRLYQNP